MSRMGLPASIAATLLLSVPAGSASPDLRSLLRGATGLPLREGVNHVPDFAGDGRDALVTRGWRDNGNAHGYSIFTILLPPAPHSPRWNVVGVESDRRFDDVVTDSPHTGEDVVTAVRFVKAVYRKRRHTLLVIATRDWAASIPDPAETVIRLFALRRSDGLVGETTDYFAPILTDRTTIRYCNAEMALRQEAGLPLPADYEGGRTETGC